MLEYYKVILRKVSFNSDLFEKELKKAMRHLNSFEQKELQKWLMENYFAKYPSVITKYFHETVSGLDFSSKRLN